MKAVHIVSPFIVGFIVAQTSYQTVPSNIPEASVSLLKITPGISDQKELLRLYGKSLTETRPGSPMMDGWTYYRLKGTKTDIQFYFALEGNRRPIQSIRVYFDSPDFDSDVEMKRIPKDKADLGILAGIDERMSLQKANEIVFERLKGGRSISKAEGKTEIEYTFGQGSGKLQRHYRLTIQANDRSRLDCMELTEIDL